MTKRKGINRRDFVTTTTGVAGGRRARPHHPDQTSRERKMPPLQDLRSLRRLIRMVGPSAAATATPVVVVTKSRRLIPFRFVMDLPSSSAGYEACSGSWRSSAATLGAVHERVQNAEGVLIGACDSGVPTGSRIGSIQPQGVAARPETQQRVAHVDSPAGERGRGVVLCEALQVRWSRP